ncbi:uncharacterized protein PFL1_02019 [Pseudozyma flocculosa PF-1]|uniref:GST N-terminal domain-containing protein n=1 Tax=Pseudozyma flocculosa TaxID=84751 RepID=A0A5C3F1I5_9BASI|nr:uncharacterized protein PFL1_02019 [Pseudozyma flocculosa PF-1]EPQ30493.1 hypothetical protein PFL1_02019 [Pseudozyma flocculosa PF-1]SPO37577.1 uncharacterized protein PSFLO_03052 [Pseudozyma flocculosa]
MSSSSSSPRVVLYGYDASPFYQKMLFLLAHYKVDFVVVKVAPMPPRPALSELLGVTYRRIPVMFLDGQAYFETTLCARALEAAFGGKPGHGHSLFDKRDEIIQVQLSATWSETQLFRLAVGHLPKAAFTPAFVADRSKFMPGVPFSAEAVTANLPYSQSQLYAHLASIEAHLAQQQQQQQAGSGSGSGSGAGAQAGRFLVGEKVSYVDICTFVPLQWVQSFGTARDLLPKEAKNGGGGAESTTPFPRVVAWLSDVKRHLAQQGLAKAKSIKAEEAATLILEQAEPASITKAQNDARVSASDPLVKAGWVDGAGQQVLVTPTDTGKVPQQGSLVALDPTQITILVRTNVGNGAFLAHFPRVQFDVRKVELAKNRDAKI